MTLLLLQRMVPGPFAISHAVASFSYDLYLITFFFFILQDINFTKTDLE